MGRRPKISCKSITKTLRLTARDAVFLENYCLENGISISEVFRRALSDLQKGG